LREGRVELISVGAKTWLGVAITMVVLAFLALLQLEFMNQAGLVSFRSLEVELSSGGGFMGASLTLQLLGMLAALLAVIYLHEGLHYLAAKVLGVEAKILPVVAELWRLKIPYAFSLAYSKATKGQYFAIALAPQIISAALLALTVALKHSSFPYFLYFVHLVSSGGDVYGMVYTLAKFRLSPVMLSCVVKGGKIEAIRVEYVKNRR